MDSKVSGGFRFAIDADDFVTYATAFNGKSIIRSLIVQSTTARIATNVTLELSLHAQGKDLSQPWIARIGTLASDAVQFENLSFDFYSEMLFQQKDAVPAELKIIVKEEGELVAETMWNLELHSPNTWLWSESSQEILAAFVQPNHPSIRPVLDEAVKILQQQGESTSLSGYQDLSHVRPMAMAIYQAMLNQQITYSNPPLFWDLPGGQRIRDAQTILDEKVGTCLDTAILFASLLEAVGLYPVVAVIPRHAFVGFWTEKYFSEQPQHPIWTERPIEDVMNAVDSGYIELFETTTICIGEGRMKYSDAVAESHRRISATSGLGENAQGSTLINVAGCRRLRPRPIRPLPATYRAPDGTTSVVEYQPTEFSVNLLKSQMSAEGAQGAAAGAVGLNVPVVVKRWLDSLLDLSGRNPLINFKEPATCVPLLAAPEILGVIEDLLQNRQTLSLVSGSLELDARGQVGYTSDATPALAEALSKKLLLTKFGPELHKSNLRKMANSAKTFLEETGSNGLYLALGSLNWTTKDEKKVRSPLILLPVTIVSKNRGREFFLTIDEGGQVMPNFSLAEKLFRDEGIKLENLVNLVEDESGVDIDGTFAYIRKTLADAGIMDFRVDENAVLGFFNFSTYRLWRDLLDNWKLFEENPLVKHFINSPGDDFIDPANKPITDNLDELVAKLPISSDASQARAISQAMAGRTFILQGPPGTGKSQTITNLLARALSEGKRVLFVAEKKDALDVVKDRLDAAGLGAFSLDLHDKGMNPKVVKEQLSSVIDIAIAADRVGFDTARGEYEGALTPLVKYRERLHEKGRLTESIYSALDQKLAVQGTTTLIITGEFIANATLESKDTLLKSARALAEMGPQTGIASTNPWSLAAKSAPLTAADLDELKSIVKSMRSSLESVNSNSATRDLLAKADSLQELMLVKTLLYKEAQLLLHVDLTSMTSQDAQRNAIQSVQTLKEAIDSFGVDISRLDSLDVEAWITKAQEADTAFALVKGLKQGGVLKKITAILGVAVTSDKTQLVATLEKLRALKMRKKQAEVDLTQIPGLRFDVTLNLYQPEIINEQIAGLARLDELTHYLTLEHITPQAAQELFNSGAQDSLRSLVALGTEAERLAAIIKCTEASINLWKGTTNFGTRFANTVAEWTIDGLEHSFSQLTRWLTLVHVSQPFVEHELEPALLEVLTGKVNFVDAPNAFLNGYYEALVRNLIVERGFNTFEAMTINNHVKNLELAHNEIRDRLPRITGAELLARRGFDSSMKVGAIGDLVATLKQPKNKIPIRTILAKHWGVINKVTPCVLASPDSCVRFLDPQLPPFDLVVFDEASQIRVANSIGAIGRSKAVIVVGDSKQMPPTSVAQVKTSDNEEDEDEIVDSVLAIDSESILDHCETVRVPAIMLNWHYRSEDESLIAFSNKKYYEGKLNSFPSPSTDKSFKGLSFQYVPNGQFIRKENIKDETKGAKGTKAIKAVEEPKGTKGTNPAEIDAIMDYLAKRLKDPANQNDSIGIVTFNKPQMDEIKTRLTDSPNPDIQRALAEGVGGEEIFVKNLETVQGSERDVILFSVAFSKNTKGDLPLNFGPLTNSGGQRRLNVAITRARKQVRIFCSFKPDELINRNSSSLGISHLAQFLKMANKEDDELSGVYVTHESHPDRMRKQILKALCDAGLNAVEEVGLSDFKVDIAIYPPNDKSSALLGILLDGPRWNARETVSDRDCLSVSLLRDKMGWPAIERIWLASWLRNPADEVARIKEIYETILTSGPVRTEKKERKIASESIFTLLDPVEVESGENLFEQLIRKIEEWSPLNPVIVGDKSHLDYLYNKQVSTVIGQMADQLTKAEGPVSADRFAKFVGTCFGLSRVVATRADSINSLPLTGHQRDDEGFIYPLGETFFTFTEWRRGSETTLRHIQDVSLCEISNAMRDICAVAQGVRPEQLVKEVSRLFGIVKMSSAITQRLEMALAFGLHNGRLTKNGEYIQAQ